MDSTAYQVVLLVVGALSPTVGILTWYWESRRKALPVTRVKGEENG